MKTTGCLIDVPATSTAVCTEVTEITSLAVMCPASLLLCTFSWSAPAERLKVLQEVRGGGRIHPFSVP